MLDTSVEDRSFSYSRLALSGQEGLLERLMNSSSKQLSLMIAVGKEIDGIRPLVRYLTEKDAAGVSKINTLLAAFASRCTAYEYDGRRIH